MKLAFVTPWYGPDAPGGAEALARSTAEELCRRGLPVEVLTTCARDLYSDWGRNDYSPGLERVRGVPVHRFSVRRDRDREAFDAINLRLMVGAPISPTEEEIFIREMITSDDLSHYIAANAQDYILFFVGYMFGTTYWGSRICPERSWLIPCLHDESYARLSIYRPMFASARGLLFLSRPEQDLAYRLYPIEAKPSTIIGAGVDASYPGDAQAFRNRFGIEGPFILYAGRKEEAKNVPLLLEYFHRYRQTRAPELRLVLTGGGPLTISARPNDGVYDLGRLSRKELFDAYAAASVLCQPSDLESFSLVLMEAWVTGTPALVSARCAVTTDFVRRANGGLYFSDYDEFALCLTLLLRRPGLGSQLGAQGRQFLLANFTWDIVAQRYEAILRSESL